MSFFDALMSQFIFTAIMHLSWIFLGEIIAAHQHGIICRSRQLQIFLHLPRCTHIFSEADTEIPQDDIKFAAVALFVTALFSGVGMLGILTNGPTLVLSQPWSVCGVFALIVTPLLVLWIRLAFTCRRRQRNRRAVAWDIEDASTDDPKVARRVGGDEDTALLPSEKDTESDLADKVEDEQLKQDGAPKKGAETAGKSSRGGGHRNAHVTRVSWDNSELPFVLGTCDRNT